MIIKFIKRFILSLKGYPVDSRTPVGETKIPDPIMHPTMTVQPLRSVISDLSRMFPSSSGDASASFSGRRGLLSSGLPSDCAVASFRFFPNIFHFLFFKNVWKWKFNVELRQIFRWRFVVTSQHHFSLLKSCAFPVQTWIIFSVDSIPRNGDDSPLTRSRIFKTQNRGERWHPLALPWPQRQAVLVNTIMLTV